MREEKKKASVHRCFSSSILKCTQSAAESLESTNSSQSALLKSLQTTKQSLYALHPDNIKSPSLTPIPKVVKTKYKVLWEISSRHFFCLIVSFYNNTLAFCMTFPLVDAQMDGGRLRISEAQFTGKEAST